VAAQCEESVHLYSYERDSGRPHHLGFMDAPSRPYSLAMSPNGQLLATSRKTYMQLLYLVGVFFCPFLLQYASMPNARPSHGDKQDLIVHLLRLLWHDAGGENSCISLYTLDPLAPMVPLSFFSRCLNIVNSYPGGKSWEFPFRHKVDLERLGQDMQDMLVLPLLTGALRLVSGVNLPKLLHFLKRGSCCSLHGWCCSLHPVANDCMHLHTRKLNGSCMQLATRCMHAWWPHGLTCGNLNITAPAPTHLLEQMRNKGCATRKAGRSCVGMPWAN
jgi:hypothetical protein